MVLPKPNFSDVSFFVLFCFLESSRKIDSTKNGRWTGKILEEQGEQVLLQNAKSPGNL